MRARIFAWLTFGVVALVIVTAILASAVTAAQVAGDLKTATNQLETIRKADAAAESARIKRSAKINGQLTYLQRQNAAQARHAQIERRYMARLARELRMHGIQVPNPPRVTVTAHPKGPRRTHPATPGHTGHGPRNPSSTPTPSTACGLVPTLCPFLSLPTTLP